MGKKCKFVYFSILQLNFVFWVSIWSNKNNILSSDHFLYSWSFCHKSRVLSILSNEEIVIGPYSFLSSCYLHPLGWAYSYPILTHWPVQAASVFSHALFFRNAPGLTLSLCVTCTVSQRQRKQPTALPCCCRLWEILWGCSRLSHLIHVIPVCLLPLQSTENKKEVWILGLVRVLSWKEGTNLTLRFGICLCLSSFRARVEEQNTEASHIWTSLLIIWLFLLSPRRFYWIAKLRKYWLHLPCFLLIPMSDLKTNKQTLRFGKSKGLSPKKEFQKSFQKSFQKFFFFSLFISHIGYIHFLKC